ncbi:MAG: hypothetical protein HC868_14890 [Sphingomonadales bacterium]|nr:hypothetical protein [Sphingomonadales bacterium]
MTSTLARRLDALADWRRALDRAVEQFSAFLVDHELRDAAAAAKIDALRQRGHEIMPSEGWTMRVGGMQAVAINRETGTLTGAADPRRDGYVATP